MARKALTVLILVLIASVPARGAREKPIGLVGTSYGLNEIEAFEIQVLGGDERYAHERLGESLPVSKLDGYGLVIVAQAVEKPLSAQESAAVRAYLETGGHLLLVSQVPDNLADELGVGTIGWMDMGKTNWHRNGLAMDILVPDHPLLAGVVADDKKPAWLKGYITAPVNAGSFDNVVGTRGGETCIGIRPVGKGWVAYSGFQLFRMKNMERDPEGYAKILRNIVALAYDDATWQACRADFETRRLQYTFEDVSEALGIKGADSTAAFCDFDLDGWPDLYARGNVYRNIEAQRFEHVGAMGQTWGDYDNDGYPDLIQPDGDMARIWRNKGDGSFEDLGKVCKMPTGHCYGMVWLDFENDGDLDFHCVGYENSPVDGRFANDGNGKFTEVWRTPGKRVPGRGLTTADFDEDGDVDIYVSNYRLAANHLWLNDGDGNFTEVAAEYGVAGDLASGWYGHTIGSCFGDLDNDGHLDLFVGNFSHPPAYQDRPKFYRNLGPAGGFKFQDMSATANLPWQETFATPTMGDYDNDGDLDIYFTTVGGRDHGVLLRNDGNWRFRDITREAGIPFLSHNYQAAWGDYDNDGDLDLMTGGRMFQNRGGDHHWLKVRLVGSGGKASSVAERVNRSAIGAQARIRLPSTGSGRAADRTLTRQITSSIGQGNANDFVMHFGLGGHVGPVEVQITWPNGSKQTVTTELDRTIVVTYGME